MRKYLRRRHRRSALALSKIRRVVKTRVRPRLGREAPKITEFLGLVSTITPDIRRSNTRAPSRRQFFPQAGSRDSALELMPSSAPARNCTVSHDRSGSRTLVRAAGFSQRRKQVGETASRKSLPTGRERQRKIGASVQARAEDLSLAQWISLTNWRRCHTGASDYFVVEMV